jgi:hypothetical protein
VSFHETNDAFHGPQSQQPKKSLLLCTDFTCIAPGGPRTIRAVAGTGS